MFRCVKPVYKHLKAYIFNVLYYFSYKLWHAYLEQRRKKVRGRVANHPSYELVNEAYERALVTLHKMPVIW
jgi:hypothetical protein